MLADPLLEDALGPLEVSYRSRWQDIRYSREGTTPYPPPRGRAYVQVLTLRVSDHSGRVLLDRTLWGRRPGKLEAFQGEAVSGAESIRRQYAEVDVLALAEALLEPLDADTIIRLTQSENKFVQSASRLLRERRNL